MYGGLKEKNLPKKHGKKPYTPPQDGKEFKKQVPDHAEGAPPTKHVGKPPFRLDKSQSSMHVDKSIGNSEDELNIGKPKKNYRMDQKQDKYADDASQADKHYKR